MGPLPAAADPEEPVRRREADRRHRRYQRRRVPRRSGSTSRSCTSPSSPTRPASARPRRAAADLREVPAGADQPERPGTGIRSTRARAPARTGSSRCSRTRDRLRRTRRLLHPPERRSTCGSRPVDSLGSPLDEGRSRAVHLLRVRERAHRVRRRGELVSPATRDGQLIGGDPDRLHAVHARPVRGPPSARITRRGRLRPCPPSSSTPRTGLPGTTRRTGRSSRTSRSRSIPGAKIGVIGPNGAGKSSLLRIMAGLDDGFTGEARLTPGFTVGLPGAGAAAGPGQGRQGQRDRRRAARSRACSTSTTP